MNCLHLPVSPWIGVVLLVPRAEACQIIRKCFVANLKELLKENLMLPDFGSENLCRVVKVKIRLATGTKENSNCGFLSLVLKWKDVRSLSFSIEIESQNVYLVLVYMCCTICCQQR